MSSGFLDALIEAERRGILPDDKKAALDEARKRGLVPNAVGGVATNSEAVGELEQKLKSMAAGATNMLSLGLADEATGIVKGAMEAPGEGTFKEGYARARDAVRGEHKRLQEEESGPYAAGQIGGITAMLPLSTGPQMSRNLGLLPRMLRSSAEGAALGGVYGFGEGEGIEDRLRRASSGIKLGGTVGAITPAVGAGIQKYLDDRAVKKTVKALAKGADSTDELLRKGQAEFQKVDNAGVVVRPDATRRGMDDIVNALRGEGAAFRGAETVLPASRGIMQAADDVGKTNQGVPFSELHMLRRYMGNAAGSNLTNKGDTRAATKAIGQMDDFVQGLSKADVDAGDIQALQTALPKANKLWQRMAKSQTIDDAIENSEMYLSGGASGIRNQFKRIVNNKALSRGFTDAEMKVLKRVAQGTLPEQALYLASGGLGNLMAMGGGALMGGPLGFLAGTGMSVGMRKVAEAVARKNAETARAVVASGGLKNLPVASEAPRKIMEALIRRSGSVVPQ